MDEHGDNAPPDHGNTALQLGLSATKDRRQYPELPVDSIFPAPVSSSSSSGISHVSPTSYESVLFSRFKEFGFIWDRAWIGFVVDPGILNIVKEYTEDFQDTTSFKIVGFQEFICDIECMDGAEGVITVSSGDSDIGQVTVFLKLHGSSTHAHFVLSKGSNEAGSSIIDGLYRLNTVVSNKSDFVHACRSFQRYVFPRSRPGDAYGHLHYVNSNEEEELYPDSLTRTAFEWEPDENSKIFTDYDSVVTRFRQQNFRESYTLAPRIYGDDSNDTKWFIHVYIDSKSTLWSTDLTDISHPFIPLKICVKHSANGYTWSGRRMFDPMLSHYAKVLDHGLSIGPLGEESSGSFGGYVEFDGQIVGLSCCHVTCPLDSSGVIYGDKAGTTIMSNSDDDGQEIQKHVGEVVHKWMSRIENGNKSDDCQVSLEEAILVRQRNTISVDERRVGNVIACSECLRTERLDWSLFTIAQERIGRNKFPDLQLYPHLPPHPRDVVDPTPFGQALTFLARTTGRATGYLRRLRPAKLMYNRQQGLSKCTLYWSIYLLSVGRLGPVGCMPGDSGAWVYETDRGNPVLMIIGGPVETECLCFALTDIFAEIERLTNHKPKLPLYDQNVDSLFTS